MKFSVSFKNKLFLLFIISILVPLIVTSILLVSYFNNLFIEETQNRLFLNTVYSISKNMQTYLDDLKRFSLTPNMQSQIMKSYEFINEGKYNDKSDPLSYFNITRTYKNIMQIFLNLSRDDVMGVVFIPLNNPDSKIYMISRSEPNINILENFNYHNEAWFDEALKNKGKPIFSPSHTVKYYKDKGSINVFSVVRLIKNVDTNKNIGVIKVDAYANTIKDIFDNIKTSDNSAFILLDQNMNIIYSTKPKLNYLVPQIQANNNLVTEDDIYHLYTKNIDNTQWQLLYMASQNDINKKTNTIYFLTLVLGILYIIVSFLIFSLKTNSMIKPLKSIIHTMKRIEKGDLEARAYENKSNDEFYLIAVQLNNMTENLNIHINNEYKAVISQKNAEYLALQTQINPHFLYNILNGFITLNRIGDKKTLENSIFELTSLFRYTCNNESTSTLEAEFKFITEYLNLQKLRFDERLNFKVVIDDVTKNIILPKLLVQPLVENSIIHGMEPSDKPVFIEVYSYLYKTKSLGEFIIIIVMDNGIGFDTKNILNTQRVGLNNIKERIELFDKNSFFVINSVYKHLTSCYIIIPFKNGR